MKKLCSLLLLAASALTSSATVLQAVANGAWTAVATWSTSTVPANGDVVIIPSGITVSITSNIVLNTQAITVLDYGTLSFNGGGSSLSLGAGSVVEVYPGGLITNGAGAGSHLINIGTNQVYKGSQGDVTGPQLASSTTTGFQSFNPLPVQFISFGVRLEGNMILIQWTTARETDVSRFEVERSTDGTRWQKIASVPASAGLNAAKDYNYVDNAEGKGLIYYRVKEVDTDGNVTYTAIKSIRTGAENDAAVVMLSQGNGNLIVQFQKAASNVIIVRIFSLSGQLVKEQNITNSGSGIIVHTNLRGNYIVSATGAGNLSVARQVIF